MATHGLTGLDLGGWQGAQSALRCPWSREQLPCGLPVCGGRCWGTGRGCAHFPAGAPNAGRWSLSSTRREGGGGLAAGQASIQEKTCRLAMCTGSFDFGFRVSKPSCCPAEEKRQGRWLPPGRGQQARHGTGWEGTGPGDRGRDLATSAQAWAGLGCGCGLRLLLLLHFRIAAVRLQYIVVAMTVPTYSCTYVLHCHLSARLGKYAGRYLRGHVGESEST
jgi:hypothetical protein